jgi:hypothetical protein
VITTPRPSATEAPGGTFPAPVGGYPDPLAELRADTCATLGTLDAAAKARASIVRSCSEVKDMSADEIDALRDLLRRITEQRKRLRAVRRLWQSLEGPERPSTELVKATERCLSECHEVAVALEPWREQSLKQVTRTVTVTWERLAGAARRCTADSVDPQAAAPSPTAISAAV